MLFVKSALFSRCCYCAWELSPGVLVTGKRQTLKQWNGNFTYWWNPLVTTTLGMIFLCFILLYVLWSRCVFVVVCRYDTQSGLTLSPSDGSAQGRQQWQRWPPITRGRWEQLHPRHIDAPPPPSPQHHHSRHRDPATASQHTNAWNAVAPTSLVIPS